jgi:hypothetical protein
VKFVNPGDLRVAAETCGSASCHASETRAVSTSMMTHTGMLWNAALYNNGGIPTKNTRFGESYDRDGKPQSLKTVPPPTDQEIRAKGVLPELSPLNRWETSQPGNVLRVFERGGEKKAELGNPTRAEQPGKPDDKLSDRGFGTELRTDPVFPWPAENAARRSRDVLARNQRSSRRLSRQRLFGVPCDLRERSRPRPFRVVFGFRAFRCQRHS